MPNTTQNVANTLRFFNVLGFFICWKLDKNIPKSTENFANIFKVFKNTHFQKCS